MLQTPLEQVLLTEPSLDPAKFRNPDTTVKGERRAVVALTRLRTLWFNTGSLCNITCKNCYMDSSPTNDQLAYLSIAEVSSYLEEISSDDWAVEEIAFTGGEPFMNPDLPQMIELSLAQGYHALVLTNAMKPLQHKRAKLLDIKKRYGNALTLRVSIDHFTRERHEDIRGDKTWEPMITNLRWLAENNFKLAVAGRTVWGESEEESRVGYGNLFKREGISIDINDKSAMVLFPEMDETNDVPEITIHCWDILGVSPESIMCATSRMVIKRKGAEAPVVAPCTLLPYDPQFELGTKLSDSARSVKLNHPHCARFCVLGGASCSAD
ncbi:MAG: radical SAM protein [Rhodospirillales bacterium]|nr:radical SAM protein [Rhodospirillales bacterium]